MSRGQSEQLSGQEHADWRAPGGSDSAPAPEWAKTAGVKPEQIALIRDRIKAAGGWGGYVAENAGKREISPIERQINRDMVEEKAQRENQDNPLTEVSQPKFYKGEFVQANGRSFEIMDPNPDPEGHIKVKEMTWEGSNIQWTEKDILETDLVKPETEKPN